MNKLDNSKLTNDAKFLISSMYAEYIKRRREQIRKSQARNFHSIDFLKTNIMPEWSKEDILDTCFELRKYGYIDTNFCEGAIVKSNLNRKSVEDKYLQEHEYLHLIDMCKDNIQYHSYFTIYLAAVTGLRFGELLGLRLEDIDKKGQMLHLKQAFDYTFTMDFIPLKSKSSQRSVPIDQHTLKLIRAYLKNQKEPNKDNRLIPNISNAAVNKTIKKIVGRPVTIHSLRHTYASFLIAQGVDLISVSQILGHENLNITLKIYAHQLEKLKEKNNDKIRNIFDNFGRISDECLLNKTLSNKKYIVRP